MHRPPIDELKPFQPSWPTKRQTDILIFLAKERKTDRYNLNKRTGISYGTIHYSLNKLMKDQFVYISSEEKSKKGGTKSIFSLTSNGFMAALASGRGRLGALGGGAGAVTRHSSRISGLYLQDRSRP